VSPTVGRRSPARWIVPDAPERGPVNQLSADLNLPETLCRLLVQRGFTEPEAAKRFLRPRMEHLGDPFVFRGMQAAAERIAEAIRRGETIMIHGDYDVDGMCSTAILVRVLRHFGAARVEPFIPNRLTDGYDLTDAGVQAAVGCGARLVVTVDCGTSALQPIADLQARGIDVIVTDHHLPGGPLPACVAILNPKQPDCPSPDKDFAAVGLAFKLALALATTLGANANVVWHFIDLVALATVADLAPLRGENRILVRLGLKVMQESRVAGVRALVRSSGLDGKPLTAGRVGFTLAPRLNAVGRLALAIRGVDLLLTDSDEIANGIARELEELNQRRQAMDKQTLDEAFRLVDTLDLDDTYGIVLAQDGWHPGVIGIVASRVVEQVARPTVLIALDGATGKGSGRSIGAFDLHGGLSACRDLLLRFGGHRAAAGVTVAREQLPALMARFNQVARERLTRDDLVPEQRIDLVVRTDELTDDLERLLQHFEPHGLGNPTPVLALRDVHLAGSPRIIKGEHLRTSVAAARGPIEAMAWRAADRATAFDPGAPVDLAVKLERNDFRGADTLRLNVVDVRPACA
jgi:single-stranded-DNA-specific exonuclease